MPFVAYIWHGGKRMKNHSDELIFHSRVCDGATNSESQPEI